MGQKWPNCDLHAIYLHGSLAMGSFYPPKSDIDLLIVVETPLDLSTQQKLHQKLMALTDRRPMTGFLELSIVLMNAVKNPKHPIPFELHYGEEFPARIREGNFDYTKAKGNDPDLAAHLTVARERGVALFGPVPKDIIGKVAWADYLNAVLDDLCWIVDKENILESPFYSILNSCRVLQMLKEGEGTVATKEEGALWALKNLPNQFHSLIRAALECYRSDMFVDAKNRRTGGLKWDRKELLTFRDYVCDNGSKLDERH